MERFKSVTYYEAGGFFSPPKPLNQGPSAPGLQLAKTPLGGTHNLRLLRWGLRKFESFWHKKAENIPGRKPAFPLGLFPGFPRMLCIRVGRFQRPGQKHNGCKHTVFFKRQRVVAISSNQAISANESPGASRPWRGSGAAEAPAFPTLLKAILKCAHDQ